MALLRRCSGALSLLLPLLLLRSCSALMFHSDAVSKQYMESLGFKATPSDHQKLPW